MTRGVDWRPAAVAGVLGGLAAALRVPFGALPNVQPSTALVVLAGLALGPTVGLGTGVLLPLLSNLALGHGPWTVFQVLGWGGIGLASGVLPRTGRWGMAAWGAVAAVAFSLLMDAWTWIAFAVPRDRTQLLFTVLRGIPFTLLHAGTTAALLWTVGPRLDALLTRARIRILGRPPRPFLGRTPKKPSSPGPQP